MYLNVFSYWHYLQNNFKSKHYTLQQPRHSLSYKVVMYIMAAQSREESTWDINNYGKYTNQFAPNTIKSIRQYERINKKICGQKMSIMFNEICIYYF